MERLKQLDKDGNIKYHTTVKYAFSEKIMMFLLKQTLSSPGRAIGLTTGTAIGNAARNTMGGGSGLCKGFLWRYAGISKEEQFSEQPVVKICCSTGKKTHFTTIADAAKDCSISPPGMRTRILTCVHADGHHWIFDKNATHYNQL